MRNKVYEMVTERIIAELEKGIIPWEKPWTGTASGAYNRISKKPYSLLNQFLLSHDGEYATLKQWNQSGGQVRKGEKAEFVVFWKIQTFTERNEDGEEMQKLVPLLRYYSVFHISQVDGVQALEKPKMIHEPIADAEKIKETYKARENLRICEAVTNEAYYSPLTDIINVPCKEQFARIEEFYSTLFHEMIHSTGHKKRLNRLDSSLNARFGSEIYSKEELTAEMGSAMLLNGLGIETRHSFRNSAAYIQNWLQVLKNDTKLVVSAATGAEKAVEFILNGTR